MNHLTQYLKNIIDQQENFYNLEIPLLQQEVLFFLHQIKKSDNLNTANTYFDKIQEIQNSLSLLLYQYHIELPYKLNKFVKDFDRIDDVDERKWYFNEIKNNEYSLDYKND